jgi:hypothetical protein
MHCIWNYAVVAIDITKFNRIIVFAQIGRFFNNFIVFYKLKDAHVQQFAIQPIFVCFFVIDIHLALCAFNVVFELLKCAVGRQIGMFKIQVRAARSCVVINKCGNWLVASRVPVVVFGYDF